MIPGSLKVNMLYNFQHTKTQADSVGVALHCIALHKFKRGGHLLSLAMVMQVAQISLFSNGFTGPLPDAWGSSMTQLAEHLRNNSLTGTLPKTWAALTQVSSFEHACTLSAWPICSAIRAMWGTCTILGASEAVKHSLVTSDAQGSWHLNACLYWHPLAKLPTPSNASCASAAAVHTSPERSTAIKTRHPHKAFQKKSTAVKTHAVNPAQSTSLF